MIRILKIKLCKGLDLEKATLRGLEVEEGREMGFSLERYPLSLTLTHRQGSLLIPKIDFFIKADIQNLVLYK